MTVETHSTVASGSEDTTTSDNSNGNNMSPKKPTESTLLTPAQTYFADEKIQIPETEVSVWLQF